LLHQEAHSAASSEGLSISRDVLLFDGIVPHPVNPKGAIRLGTPPYAFPGSSAPAVITVTFQTVISYGFENTFLAHDVAPNPSPATLCKVASVAGPTHPAVVKWFCPCGVTIFPQMRMIPEGGSMFTSCSQTPNPLISLGGSGVQVSSSPPIKPIT
jgi:hypothetical protein